MKGRKSFLDLWCEFTSGVRLLAIVSVMVFLYLFLIVLVYLLRWG